ncbi:MAG: hypothetical protein QOG33_231 [Gaiellales bacterium]|nr:hypothetical protein [Gaiellales bacterium]
MLEDEGGDTEAAYVVAEFDAAKNFYIQAISEHCEVVSRANAPELTEAQEATLRQLGWQEPFDEPVTRRWFKRRASTPPENWTMDVDDDRPVDECLEICRRTAEWVFQRYEPVTLRGT